MADQASTRPSSPSRRRRPHVKYQRAANGFARVLAAFNKALDEHFPLVSYRDCINRNRVSGRARRARALSVLQVLLALQVRSRSGIVYAGYGRLGTGMHRSRSTAFRAIKDLRRVKLLECKTGGGKTHDEAGFLVDAANGYEVPEQLRGPEGARRPRKPKAGKRAAGNPRSPGQVLAEERLEAHRAMRAGP